MLKNTLPKKKSVKKQFNYDLNIMPKLFITNIFLVNIYIIFLKKFTSTYDVYYMM